MKQYAKLNENNTLCIVSEHYVTVDQLGERIEYFDFLDNADRIIEHGFKEVIYDEDPGDSKYYNKTWKFVEEEDCIRRIFILDKIDIDVLRDIKLNQIQDERNKREVAPLMVNNLVFDCDTMSVMRIQIAYAKIMGTVDTIEWTLEDNTIIQLSAYQLKLIIDSIANRGDEIFIYSRKLKNKIIETTDWDWLSKVEWGELL